MYAPSQVSGSFRTVAESEPIDQRSEEDQGPMPPAMLWNPSYTTFPSAPWVAPPSEDNAAWSAILNDPHSIVPAEYGYHGMSQDPRHTYHYAPTTPMEFAPMMRFTEDPLTPSQPSSHGMTGLAQSANSSQPSYVYDGCKVLTMRFGQQMPASAVQSYNSTTVHSSASDESFYAIGTPSTQSSASPASLSLSFASLSPTLSHCSTGEAGRAAPKPRPKSQPAMGAYVCDHCDKRFSRPYNLKSHLRTHTKERPYVCTHIGCTWKFVRPHDLKRHQLLHSGHKPHVCTNCRKRFARSDALKRHLKVDLLCAHAVDISRDPLSS